MSGYKTQQQHFVHRGRSFHLVSYEGRPADEKRQQPAAPPSWYLMLDGKRWLVGPQRAEASQEEQDRQFGEWLDANFFGDAPAGQGPLSTEPGRP